MSAIEEIRNESREWHEAHVLDADLAKTAILELDERLSQIEKMAHRHRRIENSICPAGSVILEEE